jgi:hypothetical protein
VWLYPCLVAGARRSELLRSWVEDFDFVHHAVSVREKIKKRERETFRTIDMTPMLRRVVKVMGLS